MAAAGMWDPCLIPSDVDVAAAFLHTFGNTATLADLTNIGDQPSRKHPAMMKDIDFPLQSIWAESSCQKTPVGSAPVTPRQDPLPKPNDRSPGGALACRVAESVVVTPDLANKRRILPTTSMMSLAAIDEKPEEHSAPAELTSPNPNAPLVSEMTNYYMQTQRLIAKQLMMYPPPAASTACTGNETVSSNACTNNEMTAFAILEFKMNRRHRFKCLPGVRIAQGQFCIVQLDARDSHMAAGSEVHREDAGLCVGAYPWADRGTVQKFLQGHDSPWYFGTVIRVATEDDCLIINNELPVIEQRALKLCHELVHFLHVPFDCVDAECMFDRKACKVYYTLSPQAETSIVPNVPRLQRELSLRMHLRVFLEQVKPAKPFGTHHRQ